MKIVDTLKNLFSNSKSQEREIEQNRVAEVALNNAKIELQGVSDDFKQTTKSSQVEFQKSIKELRDVAREIARAAGQST